MLTKKDFKAVAEIIAGSRPDKGGDYESGYNNNRRDISYHLANYFATQDPRFDRSQFMKACGLTE